MIKFMTKYNEYNRHPPAIEKNVFMLIRLAVVDIVKDQTIILPIFT